MAEPLVFLPGMMCDARLFWPQLMAFGASRAVTFAPLTGAASIGALTSAVREVAPRRFALIGHGLGAVVAAEILRREPGRVTRVAFLSGSLLPENPRQAAAREPDIVGAQTGKLDAVMRARLGPAAIAQSPDRGEILSLLLDMADALGPEVFVAQSRALQRRPDQEGFLHGTRVPALVLGGGQDGIVPAKRYEFLAELIPNALLRIIPDAAHFPTLERPSAVNEALREWLAMPGARR